jgi:hypothetical protein
MRHGARTAGAWGSLMLEPILPAFDSRLAESVHDKLAAVSPRDLRKTLLDGLGWAAAGGTMWPLKVFGCGRRLGRRTPVSDGCDAPPFCHVHIFVDTPLMGLHSDAILCNNCLTV